MFKNTIVQVEMQCWILHSNFSTVNNKTSCEIAFQTWVMRCIISCCWLLWIINLLSWYSISVELGVHPTTLVLLTHNSPLGILNRNIASPLIKKARDLTHFKFDNRLRTFWPKCFQSFALLEETRCRLVR